MEGWGAEGNNLGTIIEYQKPDISIPDLLERGREIWRNNWSRKRKMITIYNPELKVVMQNRNFGNESRNFNDLETKEARGKVTA